MSARIVQLSEDVINQIAAGEVIEHPASVVKELLDNSIDAGATEIQIDILGGGHQQISVSDNGCGMSQEEVPLCLLRHATSKIRSAEDLQHLATMGFRGEALAAIASISKVEIRTSEGNGAARLCAEGGKILAIEPAARGRGTSFEVHSLFYNAPARRKFQKSAASSTAQIVKMVETLALSHPEIAFSLFSQGQRLIHVAVQGWKERLDALLGSEAHTWIEGEDLKGCLGAAGDARKNRVCQHLFLNRRPIVSPPLAKAVQMGYGTRLEAGMFPSFALFLELDASEFDVNVHPQKKEVRFRDESAVFRKLKGQVERAWVKESIALPAVSFFRPEPFAYREAPIPAPRQEPELPWEAPPKIRPLALVGCFLLAEKDKEFYVVDLREEQIQEALAVSCQPLLLPVEIELTRSEIAESGELIERCSEAGIEARVMGSWLWLEALPAWLSQETAPAFIATLSAAPSAKEAVIQFLRTRAPTWTLEEAALAWQRSPSPKEKRLDAAELERCFKRNHTC